MAKLRIEACCEVKKEVRFWVPASKMTLLCWDHIKKHFNRKYTKIRSDVQAYGKKRLIFGLSEDLELIIRLTSFRNI